MVVLTTRILAVMVLLVAFPLTAQKLEDLLEEREAEEEEIRRIRGTETEPAGEGDEPLSGRLRLPAGEQVERLRFSQDRPIDPEHYIVGPGDVLQLYIWGEFDLSYMLQVDPEGRIVIPTVHDLMVSGQTLRQAKERIREAAETKYPGVEMSITLTSMRYFTVYATGAVLDQGSQIVHPTARVSDLIEKAGGYVDELRGASITEEVGGKTVSRVRRFQERPVSRRLIGLHHGDGTVDQVDLDMFHATGQIELNPYLRMGDVVHVRYRQQEVYAYGAVNEPGAQEYRAGDMLTDLVTLAGGLTGEAPLDEVQIWRFLPGSPETELHDLIPAGSGVTSLTQIPDVALQPNDMVFFRGRSEWQATPTVHVHGQVRYRGRYRIYPGTSRLRDLIERAGGFTENASLHNATLIRMKARESSDPELERLRRLQSVSGLADMSPEDRAYLKTKARERKGLVAVDFVQLFREDDEGHNVLLEGGDVVFVPERRLTVRVSGQVKQPGLITYDPSLTVGDYLGQAGGFAWRASKRGARLIRARTGIREELERGLVPEPGDEIWIPEKEYFDWWAFTQSTMRTVAEALTLVVLIRSL